MTIKTCDIANGSGVRVSVFVSGCRMHCKNCFNKESWDFDAGKPFDAEAEKLIFRELDKPWIAGLSILGGEPFEPENMQPVLGLILSVRKAYPKKNIWIWSGHTFEKLNEIPLAQVILENVDYLVDGAFIERKKVLGQFYGSSNQRIIQIRRN